MNIDDTNKEKHKRPKREHGAGGVYYIASINKWRAKITINGVPKTRLCNTEKEAKAQLKLLKNIQPNGDAKYSRMSFEKYITFWLEDFKKNDLSLRSYDSLEFDINHYVLPYIKHIPIGQLSTQDIQKVINKLLEEKYSKSTIKRSYGAINGCLKHAFIQGHILRNPCIGVILPTEKRYEFLKPKEIFVMNDEQIKAYIAEATRNYPNGTYIYRMGWGCLLILSTGLRKGEAIALRWTDIDFEKKELKVSRNIVIVKNREDQTKKTIRIEQESTKSQHGQRIIPLNEDALKTLEYLKKINGNFDYVLATRNGIAQGERAISRTHESICEKIGIKCGIHSLRHTFASTLFKNGIDIKTVQTILGHADIETTYEIYIHIYPDIKEKALNTIKFNYIGDNK